MLNVRKCKQYKNYLNEKQFIIFCGRFRYNVHIKQKCLEVKFWRMMNIFIKITFSDLYINMLVEMCASRKACKTKKMNDAFKFAIF